MAWTASCQPSWLSFVMMLHTCTCFGFPSALKVKPKTHKLAWLMLLFFVLCLLKKYFLALQLLIKKKSCQKKRPVDQRRISNARQVKAKLLVEFCRDENAARWQLTGKLCKSKCVGIRCTLDISWLLFAQLNVMTILEIHLIYLNLPYQCNAGLNVQTCFSISSDNREQKSYKQKTVNIHELLCHFFKQVVWRKKKIMQRNKIHRQSWSKLLMQCCIWSYTMFLPCLNVYSQNTLETDFRQNARKKLFHQQVKPQHLTNIAQWNAAFPELSLWCSDFNLLSQRRQQHWREFSSSCYPWILLPPNSQSCMSRAFNSLFMGKWNLNNNEHYQVQPTTDSLCVRLLGVAHNWQTPARFHNCGIREVSVTYRGQVVPVKWSTQA